MTTDFGSSSDFGMAVALQSDGRIVVAGESDDDFAHSPDDGDAFAVPDKMAWSSEMDRNGAQALCWPDSRNAG